MSRRRELEQETANVADEAAAQPPVGESWLSFVLYYRDEARAVPLLEDTPAVIGRLEPSDIRIGDASLSRTHARVTLTEGRVTVEDLGSTNGTQVNGEPVTSATLHVGDEVRLGSVVGSLHRVVDGGHNPELETHDRFIARLEDELVRSKAFSRPAALLMVRASANEGQHFRHWLPQAQQLLRPVDWVAAYGEQALLIGLPEMSREDAVELARSLVEQSPVSLRCGVGAFPEDGGTAEELLEQVHRRAYGEEDQRSPVDAGTRPGASGAAQLGEMLFVSPKMQELRSLIERIGPSHIPVLIIGETGTGKELIARAIHDSSPRARLPLQCVNCGAIPPGLMEATLFGHEKGAFTGATKQTKGVFEQADGGTVFLDEIGELSPAAQAALLRVLETKRITRVGSTEEIALDVRVLAATHRDLESMCSSGEFRSDLLYRLNTMVLEVPPLRERPEDIDSLAGHFRRSAEEVHGRHFRAIDSEALDLLRRHRWPGNVRELRNVMERAVVIADGDVINSEHLPRSVRRSAQGEDPGTQAPPELSDEEVGFREHVRRYEAKLMREALRNAGGNKTKAAQSLQMPVRTFVHKFRQLGLSNDSEQ